MTVYVVTEGEYSDYHVEGIFSTREKANEYMGGHPEKFNEIKEMVVDSEQPKKWMTNWMVRIDRDGDLSDFRGSAQKEETYITEHAENYRGYGSETHYGFVGSSPISREHALKLALEARQDCLRKQSASS